MRLFFVLLTALPLAFGTACSFSKSSGSISDSISSPSKSVSRSSESSGGGDDGGEDSAPEEPEETAAYADDISQLAYTYAQNGGDIGAFRTAVARRASQRGLVNWELDPVTCNAIGRGVAKAGMGNEEFTRFSKALFGEDLGKQTALRKGYQPHAVASPPAAAAAPAPPPGADPEAPRMGAPAEGPSEASTP